MTLIIDSIAIIASIALLTYASWNDYISREVPDIVWIIFAPIGIVLTSLRLYINQDLILVSLFSVAIIAIISLIAFYTGMFGGADAKALICIALAMPVYPIFLTKFVQPMFPLSVMVNSFLMASFVSVYAVLRNIYWLVSKKGKLFYELESESLGKKILAFISGFKISIDKYKTDKHLQLIEKIESKNGTQKKHLEIFFILEDHGEVLNNYVPKEYLKINSTGNVWVTPLIPMIIFITLGYLATLIIGDTVLNIIVDLMKI
ncbi:MAG: prepilin peptidase [Candidatus Bathyarchaeota archaeon]|nr:prepilin peptidase [Candidatus Bathyarchaeota archaeon]